MTHTHKYTIPAQLQAHTQPESSCACGLVGEGLGTRPIGGSLVPRPYLRGWGTGLGTRLVGGDFEINDDVR